MRASSDGYLWFPLDPPDTGHRPLLTECVMSDFSLLYKSVFLTLSLSKLACLNLKQFFLAGGVGTLDNFKPVRRKVAISSVLL